MSVAPDRPSEQDVRRLARAAGLALTADDLRAVADMLALQARVGEQLLAAGTEGRAPTRDPRWHD